MQRLEITLISTFFSCHKVKNHVEETYSTVKQSNSFKFENESKEHTRSSDNRHRNEFYERDGCFIQDARLNLWFTVAVAFSYVMCALLGPLMRKAGLRFFRLFFILVYVIGAVCVGYATKVTPWLLCPGLCCIGIAGMALYATSIQVSFLFPAVQSTIAAFLVGVFDISTIIVQLVKVAFEYGISRKISFTILAVLHVALVGTSTFILLPATRIDPFSVKKGTNTKLAGSCQEKNASVHDEKQKENNTVALRQIVFSSFFVLHIYWMSVKCLRFVTYIGLLNVWIESLYPDNPEKESRLLSAFSYITTGSVLFGPTAGLLHDYQRKKYLGDFDIRRQNMPMVIPFMVTTIISVACTSVALVKHEGGLYISFILFTAYRVYVYSYEITYLSDAFPLIHFTMLYGILQSTVGLTGMLQYALFSWYDAYVGATVHVNLFLIVLDLSTLAHPANIWYQCRKHHHDSKALTLHRKSIHIFAKPANNDYITTDILEESNDVPLSRDLSIPNDLVLSNDYTETDTLVVPNGHKIVSDLATPNDTAEVQNDDVISTECQPLR